MIRLRQQHWTFAFILALAAHMAIFISMIDRPGRAPIYKGGGSFEQEGEQSPAAAGVFVQLGKSGESSGEEPGEAALEEQAPEQTPRQSLAQAFVTGEDEPGTGTPEAAPAETPEPASERLPDQTVSAPAEEVAPAPETTEIAEVSETNIAAAAVPRSKPLPPSPLPELETLGRRLGVQGPDEAVQPAPQATAPAADTAPQDAAKSSAGTPAGAETATSALAFADPGGGVGTASGNRTGEVRELNYEDRVMLWLKRHGSYPYEAAMWQLEGTVLLKFAINREGEILYYNIVKKSRWHLLNAAVRKMMQRSSPVPPIPPEIETDQITFTIPVHFEPYRRK